MQDHRHALEGFHLGAHGDFFMPFIVAGHDPVPLPERTFGQKDEAETKLTLHSGGRNRYPGKGAGQYATGKVDAAEMPPTRAATLTPA